MTTYEPMIQPDELDKIEEINKLSSQHPTIEELLHHEMSLVRRSIVSEPISADCHNDYKAFHTSGRRPLSEIDLIVVHSTEGGTARTVASYFSTPGSGGSAHLVVDDNACERCLRDDQIPWGAPGANYNGFHIEQCGYAKWVASLWSSTHRKTLMRAAYKAALHYKRYLNGSPRFLTAANLKAGMRNGITTHAECSKAFGGDHVDPGKGWPRVLFMTLVRGYFISLKVRKIA
jgi:hypothetical protein